MRNDSAKLQVRLWKYKSNPVLKDTDFDGLEDNEDKVPKDNHFTGRMHTTRLSGNNAIEVDMTMDYRYFFLSNKLYYDELSTMSLLYSNSIYRKGEGQSMHSGLQLRSANNFVNDSEPYTKDGVQSMNIDKFKNLPVKEMMTHFGFKDVMTYYMGEEGSDASDGSDVCKGNSDTHKGRVAIGYRNIEYHGLTKTVIGIVIRGTAEDDDWDSDFDMGDLDYKNGINTDKYDSQYIEELNHFTGGYDSWITPYHHAGFDIVANRILEVVGEYITTYSSNFEKDRCFWITGHSMGAGVANLVSAYILNGYGAYGGNRDNVYCYTFAAPNTFYSTDNDEGAEPKGIKYRCIFNIVNDDDFVPKLPMEECEWTKYGREAKLSVNNIKSKIPSNFSPIYDPYGSYYKLWLKYSYKSNITAIGNVIYMLNGVYDDSHNMRKETYSYDSKLSFSGGINYSQSELKKLNEEIKYIDIEDLDDFVFDYSRPYQKNEKDLLWYTQEQTPAYLMQSIAGAMHTMINDHGEIKEQGEDNSFLGSKVKDNQFRFIKTKMAHSGLGAKWSILVSGGPLNALEVPHYLESYYSLTKEVSTTDFR